MTRLAAVTAIPAGVSTVSVTTDSNFVSDVVAAAEMATRTTVRWGRTGLGKLGMIALHLGHPRLQVGCPIR